MSIQSTDISRQNRLLEEQILQTSRSDIVRAVAAYIQEVSARPTVADISRQNRLLEEQSEYWLLTRSCNDVIWRQRRCHSNITTDNVTVNARSWIQNCSFANITLRRPPSGVGVHPGALGADDRRRHKSAKPPARGAE
ncbi:hypothetical protein EVAR_96399_1 [Eumeta japonica]|uniref:Uncharacterized protein n=1 Tax=Eumeta variegata TaxID=151549 RepID=A0A4C1WBC3_EUMVA|nr:hypothetical protein EVAR_96399_1 [Eumeta japonica]